MSDVHEVVIQDLAVGGSGVARVGDRACFIRRALPGDRVRVSVESRSKFLSGIVEELLEPSPHRVAHPCPHAEECPASIWGTLSYEKQLEVKRSLVARTLRKMIGKVDVLPTVASVKRWHYRNRLSLHVSARSDHLVLGYQKGPRMGGAVPIGTCKLASEPIDDLLQRLAERFRTVRENELGRVPHRLQIHETRNGAGLMLIAQTWDEHDYQRWTAILDEVGVPGGSWFVEGEVSGKLRGHRRSYKTAEARQMRGEWLSIEFELRPGGFAQVNHGAAGKVLERLKDLGQHETFGAVWDLYGGYGALGYALAGAEHPLHVIEISHSSEVAFYKLGELLHAPKGEFIHEDTRIALRERVTRIQAGDVVVLDPPRFGVHPQVSEMIGDSLCRCIIYLSCEPASLARDLQLFQTHGFRPIEIQPYDFFPQTPEIETLVIAKR